METEIEILAGIRVKMWRTKEVERIVELIPSGEPGRYLYLIETPHKWPRYVIGTTDALCDDVRVVLKCGELWSANAAWEEKAAASRCPESMTPERFLAYLQKRGRWCDTSEEPEPMDRRAAVGEEVLA